MTPTAAMAASCMVLNVDARMCNAARITLLKRDGGGLQPLM